METKPVANGPIQLQAPRVESKGNVVDTSFLPVALTEEQKVLRKIDRTVLPMMCAVFFLQYLDKQSLSYAGVFGVIEDLELTPQQFSIIWGAICLCLAAPTKFAGFATVRFLLGITEGCVSPAFVTITAIWYQKKDHASRTATWLSMNGLAQVLGCLLTYGIGVNDSLGLAPWRTLFLVCGALTIAVGVVFYILMPCGPNNAWFLNERDKEVLSARMAQDREGGDKTSFSVVQLREALRDPKVWCVFWFGVLTTMQAPVLTFASLVINSIGYDRYQTMLYTAPSGAVQIALLWTGVFLCWVMPQKRTFVVLIMIVPPLAATILLLELPLDAGWGVIVASWLASCISAVASPLLSLVSSNFKGNTKRAVVNCLFFMGYCAGCIGAPQLWTERPRYFKGVVTSIVTWLLLAVVVLLYRFLCMRDNTIRDGEVSGSAGTGIEADSGPVTLDKLGQHEADLTDKQDRGFRYSW
ncbi:hypothetical protein MCOR27_000395 [Pyricularia oryzae]|nr:hypothetical protein MCOR19_000842 [Pyricularia oryzae]KAI6289069.1 hypothetical protein MCOR27_000395 [Pyricularia oryzae]KAI6364707.1 hypothetical protein MCOR31_007265 [Pyricularia oryzae]KAI6391774.1 hypothetical protein MCOR23_008805 [Pyricularia oryzae]KAI6396236.1 hypothetical protein MCOR24_009160 [Pyricularia oryzae]